MIDFIAAGLNEPQRLRLGAEVPLTTFRLLRLIGMQEILGESTGPTLYMAGKALGRKLPLGSADDFLRFIERQKVGVPELERLDANNLSVRVWECMTCSGMPNMGQVLCHFESGLMAGAMEKIWARRTRSTQIKGISNGDPYCEFKVFLF